MSLSQKLKAFDRRVRIVRSWRGLAIGATLGAGLGVGWAVLDWVGVAYTEPIWMGGLIGGSALIGALVGAFGRVSTTSLTQSIDRRAGLDDRLSTANEGGSTFDTQIKEDAESRVGALRPSKVYPIRVGRWQAGAVATSIAATSIFLLGNTPIFLSEAAMQERKEVQQEGKKVERVTKENLEIPQEKSEMTEAEKRLADELRQYQRALEKARMTKEESMQKSAELAQKANELTKESAAEAEQSLQTAAAALEKAQQEALAQANMGEVTPAMAQMSDAEREQAKAQNKAKQADLQKQIEDAEKRLAEIAKKLAGSGLSKAERDALEAERKALEAKRNALKKELEGAKTEEKALELSKEARDVFNKMMNDPLFKQIQEMRRKLAAAMKDAKAGKRPALTAAERAEMKRKLEEFARAMKDDKAMQEYLKALLASLKKAGGMCRCAGLGVGLGAPLPMPGAGAGSQDTWMGDNGKINKLDKGVAGGGKTTPSMLTGDKREGAPDEMYVEIKAPATIGNRSGVPYKRILPSYRRKAESALSHDKIPKEHEKRVKEYFQSLGQ